jgi:hypothetical protein
MKGVTEKFMVGGKVFDPLPRLELLHGERV